MAAKTTGPGFSAEEKAAMKQRAAELKAQAKAAKGAEKAAAELKAAEDAIAAMSPNDKAIAQAIHEIVLANTDLLPKTWYGFPSYARDGQLICFYQPGDKFGTRYGSLGFDANAQLDDGNMWPAAYAILKVGAAEKKAITALVKKAAGQG